MLKECRQALRITTDAYDEELCSLMRAAAADLEVSGVIIPGTVAISATVTTAGTTWNDNSTLKDPLVMRAVFTYVRTHFKSPSDYDRLNESYNTQKVQLMHADAYTIYDDDGGDFA